MHVIRSLFISLAVVPLALPLTASAQPLVPTVHVPTPAMPAQVPTANPPVTASPLSALSSATPTPTHAGTGTGTGTGTGRMIETPNGVTNIFVADPKVVDIHQASATNLFIFDPAAVAATPVDELTEQIEKLISDMGERSGVRGLRRLASVLVQPLQYGTALGPPQRSLTGEMRQEMLSQFEERAGRLPALLTVVMIRFILPSLFLTVGGPAILKVLKQFRRLKHHPTGWNHPSDRDAR